MLNLYYVTHQSITSEKPMGIPIVRNAATPYCILICTFRKITFLNNAAFTTIVIIFYYHFDKSILYVSS